jgi:hypothetical protein
MRRTVQWSLVVVALLVCSVPASAQRGTRRVFLNVTDASGAPIADLTAADFTVTEGGTARKVLRAAYNPPQRILLLVDTSSSIQQILNEWRAGLAAFIEAVPGTPEIGLATFGGPFRPRVPPAADRAKLIATVNGLVSDNGANTFFESLLEADRRLLAPKESKNAWPVLVILTTDHGESRTQPDVDAFNRLVNDLMARGANAHAIVLRGKQYGMVNEMVQNLVANMGGIFEPIAIASGVPDLMKTIGARVASDFKAWSNRYEVEFQSDAKTAQAAVEVQIAREGARLQVEGRRP